MTEAKGEYDWFKVGMYYLGFVGFPLLTLFTGHSRWMVCWVFWAFGAPLLFAIIGMMRKPIEHEPRMRCADPTCPGCWGVWETNRGDASVATEPKAKPWWRP